MLKQAPSARADGRPKRIAQLVIALENLRRAPATAFVCLAAVIFSVNALRLPRTFVYPAFWAEDGSYFFRDSIEIGSRALWQPIAGLYLTLPRVLAWLASFLPVLWAPAAYAVMAGAVSGLALASFSRPGFRWLVPSDPARAAVCLLFALSPGVDECFFALCTQMYVLFAACVLLLLEREPAGRWQMGWRRTLLVSFLWFTVGHGILLVPLLLYLLVRTRNRNYAFVLLALAASVALNLTVPNAHRPPALPTLATLLGVFVDNVLVRLLFVPLLGPGGIGVVLRASSGLFLALALATLLAVGYLVHRLARVDAEGARGLALAVLCAMSAFPMTLLTRSYGLVVLPRSSEMAIHTRYAVVPSLIALMLGWTLLARSFGSAWTRLSAYALLAWCSVNTVAINPLYVPPRPVGRFVVEWPEQAAALQRGVSERSTGTLRRKVVVRQIWCRPLGEPFEPDAAPIPKIKIIR